MTPVCVNPDGELTTVTLHEAVISTFKQGRNGGSPIGTQHPTGKPKTRHHVMNDQIIEYLRVFRQNNRKDEIISRNGLSDGLFERYPDLKKKYDMSLINRQITDILDDAGVHKIKKTGTTHQRYFWPLDVMP